MTDDEQLHPETIAVKAGRPERGPNAPLNAPIVPASTFHYGGDIEYGRDGNPGWLALEAALGELEHGSASRSPPALRPRRRSSTCCHRERGSSASGRRISALRSSCGERAERGQLQYETHATLTADGLAATIDGATLVWIESPTDPMLDVVDLPAVIAIANGPGRWSSSTTRSRARSARHRSRSARTRPHGDEADRRPLGSRPRRRRCGGSGLRRAPAQAAPRYRCSARRPGDVPRAARLRTLPMRYARGQATATELATRLADHPGVSRVRYPGIGTMIAFERRAPLSARTRSARRLA